MKRSARRWCVLAAAVVPVADASAAEAAPCRASAISGRFTEAARLCSDPASTGNSAVSAAPVVARPVVVAPRETVSVSMPGYRQRLAVAARQVRRQGGAAPTPALVTAIAHRYRINPRLLASMMHVESAGRAGAVSNKGALGLMQVMPGTARSMGVRDPQAMLTNPVLAMSTGAAYLKRLQAQFGNDVPIVVAAYNAGPGAVVKAKRGIPRYRETQGYVRKVMGGFTGTPR
jgi:soluble lytic murein transglycosylase-like protein